LEKKNFLYIIYKEFYKKQFFKEKQLIIIYKELLGKEIALKTVAF
jgi:hypothetical protein